MPRPPTEGLTFIAREPHYKARSFPQFYGPPVDKLRGLSDRLLIVSALDYGRRRRDVTVGRGDVDTIMRHWRLLLFQECKSLSLPGTAVGRVPTVGTNPPTTIFQFQPLAHKARPALTNGGRREPTRITRRAGLPGRAARGSVFPRKAICQVPASGFFIWSKVADARAKPQ